ncbi:hypothetical protein Sp245p_28985 (plasmid) [Azospirillum baldaniorum]|uniref:Uncharacterized protein n=1 Tax=Azospirillum baldaniorum TaxID=1064539 RepID=A0A9P1NQY1_9PROT|nr:hypothetical protein [Azospirillum baldaniorum]AWJ93857.1 hypothetical protein Sp245p_28985 [Azospirillum baldaniorum]TWA81682.1 hypothetical protein FBZ85_10256 [Azospirillum brasilense]CCD02018.1 protein of unknown function [Azospirillum baldaniorum]
MDNTGMAAQSNRELYLMLGRMESQINSLMQLLESLREEVVTKAEHARLVDRVTTLERVREEFEEEMRDAKKAVIKWVAGVLSALVLAAGTWAWSHVDIGWSIANPPAIIEQRKG